MEGFKCSMVQQNLFIADSVFVKFVFFHTKFVVPKKTMALLGLFLLVKIIISKPQVLNLF